MKKRETCIDLKMPCSVIFKSFLFCELASASGHGSAVYKMFRDQCLLACVCVGVCVCVRVCTHVCIKSCQLQNTYEELGESYI